MNFFKELFKSTNFNEKNVIENVLRSLTSSSSCSGTCSLLPTTTTYQPTRPSSSSRPIRRIESGSVWRTPTRLGWSKSRTFRWSSDPWICSHEANTVWCTSHQYVCTCHEFWKKICLLNFGSKIRTNIFISNGEFWQRSLTESGSASTRSGDC